MESYLKWPFQTCCRFDIFMSNLPYDEACKRQRVVSIPYLRGGLKKILDITKEGFSKISRLIG